MSRAPMGGEPIQVKPSSNSFTVLAGVGVLANILALIVLFVRAKDLLENGFSSLMGQ